MRHIYIDFSAEKMSLKTDLSNSDLTNENLFIEIAKIKYPAILEITPLKNKSIRLN